MSLSLRESCTMYERYCRRNLDTPTFESFNGKHFTCLPENQAAFDEYSRILVGARRAAGVPVTRRLPSLYKKLSNLPECHVETTADVQIRPQTNAFKSAITPIKTSMRVNIRAPNCIATPEVLKEKKKEWTVEAYKSEILNNKSILLKEENGNMVHLIPNERGDATFESLACKLTKSVWETLRGKKINPLKMRDGSTLDTTTTMLNDGDLVEFIQARKNKMRGPHYIRFSRI